MLLQLQFKLSRVIWFHVLHCWQALSQSDGRWCFLYLRKYIFWPFVALFSPLSWYVYCNALDYWRLGDSLYDTSHSETSLNFALRKIQFSCWSKSFPGQNSSLVVLFEISTICFTYFWDEWLSPLTNTRFFNVFCFHSYIPKRLPIS